MQTEDQQIEVIEVGIPAGFILFQLVLLFFWYWYGGWIWLVQALGAVGSLCNVTAVSLNNGIVTHQGQSNADATRLTTTRTSPTLLVGLQVFASVWHRVKTVKKESSLHT